MLDKMKNMFKGKAKKDMTPKELATKNKEPWVSVLTTHVYKANPKNGFLNLIGMNILSQLKTEWI